MDTMYELFNSYFATNSRKFQSVYDICMTFLRLFVDPNKRWKRKPNKNNDRIDKSIEKLRKKYLKHPTTQSSTTSAASSKPSASSISYRRRPQEIDEIRTTGDRPQQKAA